MQILSKMALTAGSLALIGSAYHSTVQAEEHDFSDTEGHWAEAEIGYLTDLGYLAGYPEGSFRPDEAITRAEAATIMFRQQGLTEKDADFEDVYPAYWAFGEIGAVQQADIMTGYGDGTFRPSNDVTRAEVATIFYNTFTYDLDGEAAYDFDDVSETHWAYEGIQALQMNHLLRGYQDGTFKPGEPITRAEFSAVMARELNEEFREDLIVMATAERLHHAIIEEDYDLIASYAHPTEGVRFSPYVYVHADHLVFHASDLEGWLDDETIYTWGTADGTGFPIEKTTRDYHDRYLTNHDYQNPDEYVYNEERNRGNTINNIEVFFPDAKFVEYYVDGDEVQYAGLDWGSNILVMQEYDGDWYLIAVVNDEWTI